MRAFVAFVYRVVLLGFVAPADRPLGDIEFALFTVGMVACTVAYIAELKTIPRVPREG